MSETEGEFPHFRLSSSSGSVSFSSLEEAKNKSGKNGKRF